MPSIFPLLYVIPLLARQRAVHDDSHGSAYIRSASSHKLVVWRSGLRTVDRVFRDVTAILERLASRHHRSTVLTIIVSSYGFVFQRLHVKLANLLLVVPATSATARRSFSCLRGNNTWINSTVSQWRLNITAIFHIPGSKSRS